MVFQDLLTNKDDYLRASRALLREIIKQTKHEINFQSFCFGLMQERKEASYVDMEFKVNAHENPSIIPLFSCSLNIFRLWTVYPRLSRRNVLLSRWQIYWPSPWCWASLLRSKKLALRGTKERRRVSDDYFLLMMYLLVLVCMISFSFNTYLVCFRSGGPQVISESDSCHTERRCVVASYCGSNHQQSWCKRLRPLVCICVYLNSLYCSDCTSYVFFLTILWMIYQIPLCVHSLHKVLFTEQPETYYKWDNWPPESDRKWVFLQLITVFLLTVSTNVTLLSWFVFHSSVSSFASALRCLCWRTHWCAFWWSGCHVICPWAQPMQWSLQITWLRGLLEFSLMVCEDPLWL